MSSLPLMPEWYLVIGILAVLSSVGLLWHPLLTAVPILFTAAGVVAVQATSRAVRACHLHRDRSWTRRIRLRAMVAYLHALHPLARLSGRLRHGLTPWRRRDVHGWTWPRPRWFTIWSEHWRASSEWLRSLENNLRKSGTRVVRGGDFDRWDLEISDGTFGSVRLLSMIEEHGAGKQLARLRLRPRCATWAFTMIVLFGLLSAAAAWEDAWLAAAILATCPLSFVIRILCDTGMAMSTTLRSLRVVREAAEEEASRAKVSGHEGPVSTKTATVLSLRQADQ
jgi:hypothetical protein